MEDLLHRPHPPPTPALRRADGEDRPRVRLRLERWLLSHDTLHLRNSAEYLLARHLHSSFHDEMRHLAYLINDRHFAEAEAFLQPSSSYERTSLLLARSLSALARISNETLIAAD